MGGDYDHPEAVRISGIAMASIPVTDLERATEFYHEVLNLQVLDRDADWTIMECGAQKLLLRRSEEAGGDRGLYLSTPSIYDVQKRLADMPVEILQPPMRGKDGLVSVIMDDDGNIIHIIETIPKV